MDSLAVFTQSPCFVMHHALAPADAIDKIGFFAGKVRRDDTQNRLADHLLRCIPEDPFCSRIPARHDTFEILRNDRVVGVLYDSRKVLLREFRWILSTPCHEAGILTSGRSEIRVGLSRKPLPSARDEPGHADRDKQ